MKKTYTLIVCLFAILFFECKKDEGPFERRFFDKIEITKAKTTGWDVLSGPDMAITLKDNLIDSLSNSLITDAQEDVVFLPITFEDVTFEIKSFIDFRVIDIDEFAPDDIMWQKQIDGYARSEEGNPFVIGDSDWTIRIFWKTQ